MDVVWQVGTPAYMAPEICRDSVNVAEVNAVYACTHESCRWMHTALAIILCKIDSKP